MAKTCTIGECKRVHRARGMCVGHYNRWLLTGNAGEGRFISNKREDHSRWAGDAVTYNGMHQRLRYSLGSASNWICTCGAEAKQWAYDHQDPDELHDEYGNAYSTDKSHYTAMCVSCHVRFDKAVKA